MTDLEHEVIATLSGMKASADAMRKATAQLDRYREACEEAIELLRGYEDVLDGDDGPRPNNAMRAVMHLQYALGYRPAP